MTAFCRYRNLAQSSLLIGLLFVLMVGCSAPPPTPQPTLPEGRDGVQITPTVPAPDFTEPSMPISAENINAIQYLGRLDAPGQPSTVFRYDISPDGTRLAGLNNDLLVGWDLLTGNVIFSTSRADAT